MGDETGDMGDNLPSIDLGTGRTATAIAAGSFHTCALLDNGSVKCWGDNAIGQLGIGNTTDKGDNTGEMAALTGISAILASYIQASKTFNDHTYALTSTSMTWAQAKDNATALGGYLTTINTKAENDWLTTELYISPGTWMGANDIATENTWVWDNGTTSGDSGLTDTLCNAPSGNCNPSDAKWADNTDKWYGLNPNNYSNNQDCGRIWKTTGHWDDDGCDNSNYGIIEFD